MGVGPIAARIERTELSDGAWVDVLPGWFEGADDLFTELVESIPWRAERRPMYDNVVDVPRLLHNYGVGEQLPHPALEEARDALSAHYRPELGEPFVTAGCCYYRDGHDSVAWHGDRIGRGRSHDTMVAIVSFGSPRKLQLRPGGRAHRGQPRARARGPDRDGRVLPAHLGARRTEDEPSGRPAHQRAVPSAQRVLSRSTSAVRHNRRMDDLPPELRGTSPDPVRQPTTPLWVRLTALVMVVAMLGFALYTVL